ncbi:transcriptional regulator VisR [Rhizobium halophytocola]|uniref:DNA-binding CsgD family transcriptional regulator n=1 Tax=Rhizobium halophytocola TaxID=735519 RepID=A0ABS4E577_9HYPH|nr:LuxR family transcriptional regulator [Rhizobium halophytocola]MBP1853104.1 DNA-binding CsgD family transcriptional regulator [Rhizobium halophytocola]
MLYGDDSPARPPIDIPGVQHRKPISRSDVFPHFLSLQKTLKARSFSVLRAITGILPGKASLTVQMENWDPVLGAGSTSVISAYGKEFLTHIDCSLLPLIWSAGHDGSVTHVSDFAGFVKRLPSGALDFSGIAFPVRPGAVGNGYVVFASTSSLDLSAEIILDAHTRCCKLMTDVMMAEERRALPADTLSEREIACLQLAGDGKISDEIAERLGLSVHTVNAYLSSATIKLDSVNRIQAIAKAIRLGFIN